VSDAQPIPGYQVEKELARGGMAAVYRARDAEGRVVALKQILPDVSSDLEFLNRFRHEVEIHARLRHPNILALHRFGAGPTHYFLAMEFVDGGSLRDLLDNYPKHRPEVALFVARETMKGLSAAHAAGVVHRDMKPQNILITRDGQVKVGDFGISKTSQMTRLTQTGNVIGTPAYMSPEQALARTLDARSDVFSVGVLLYEMLSGTNPFLTDSPAATMRMILDHHPAPLSELDPTIPVEVEMLVERLMAKSADQRPQDALTVVRALDEQLAAVGAARPEAGFAAFLKAPGPTMDARRAALSKASLERARSLIASGTASDEVILWELVQASRLDARNTEAHKLLSEVGARSDYHISASPPTVRMRELLTRLEREPSNVPLTLQAAKLAKMEKDYLRMMRLFFRVRALPVEDPYLQGQVAALVARPGAVAPPLGPRPSSPGVARPAMPPVAAPMAAPAPAAAAASTPHGPTVRIDSGAMARPIQAPRVSPVPPTETAPAAGFGVPVPIWIGAGLSLLFIVMGLVKLL